VSIKIKSLKPVALTEQTLKKDYLYKDIQLDINQNVYINRDLNKSKPLKDLVAIYDIEAVKNSIISAFTTQPGDKVLNPTYGIDLRQYLFEPINDFIIDIITDNIKSKLPRHEPRVEVEEVLVDGDEDNNTIYIQMKINVPSLGVYGLSIKSELNSAGYSLP
jgi:phage baseplate assembly protein W